ncbi:MAG TPA: hypothetical protein VMS17_06920 [Gemmataceae bacterium]|nr:hypothetical protein [Gemmataceae bacterium]
MAGISDTSPEAARVLRDVYRRMPAAKKWLILGEMYQDGRALHAAGFRLRRPDATPVEIRQHWLALTVGAAPAIPQNRPVPERSMQNLSDLREVLAVLAQLDIPYALSGSMASSMHGVPRSTRDADVTAEPFPGKESQLVGAFGEDYYISEQAVREAVLLRSSFNIINTGTGFKVDVFVRKDRPFEQSAMSRRVALTFPDAPAQPIVVYTPEDVILFKLEWHRLSNEVAEQQIKDVLGVLQVQAGRLDDAYLNRWAADLGVADLLQRARQESAL